MVEFIGDGGGTGVLTKVAADGRLRTEASTELVSANRSRVGELWGLGTGRLTIPAAMAVLGGGLLWFQNQSTDEDWYIQKLIVGNGGSSNNPTHQPVVATLIKYSESVPTTNITQIYATIENISRSTIDTSASDTTGTRKANFLGYKWNESGTDGATGGSGGFYQIPNRWALGNTTAPIDGEIILGPGDSMQIDHLGNNMVASDEVELHLSVVFWMQGAGEERAV